MILEDEITADFLNDIEEKGIPFDYSGVAQFLPTSDYSFKLVCLMNDGSWDSRSFEVDLMDKNLIESLDFCEEFMVFKEKLNERIIEIYFENFNDLLRQNHNYCQKDFTDMDNVILGFTKTLNELTEWLENQKTDIYISAYCGFNEEEMKTLDMIFYKLQGMKFCNDGAKKRFWEDILILQQEYFPDEKSDMIEYCLNLYRKD